MFGTDELVHRIETTDLKGIVTHWKIIVPQLGTHGISHHEVQRSSGFRDEYGPVRTIDLLKTGKATLEMYRAKFSLYVRFISRN